jgi:outer membrane receptor protein involved in Fe transport
LPVNNFKLNLKLGIENLFDIRYNGSVVPNASGNNFFEPASGRAVYATLGAAF